MRPGVSLGVLGYPGVSWGNQTDPTLCDEVFFSSKTLPKIYLNVHVKKPE